MSDQPVPPSTAQLPKRTARELADALRVRAALLCGEPWEVPATAAMMREAADMLDPPAPAPEPCEGDCNPYVASCGAKFCGETAWQQHERTHTAPAPAPEGAGQTPDDECRRFVARGQPVVIRTLATTAGSD